MTKDISEIISTENVKTAIRQINNTQKLSQHPFANLHIVKKRQDEKGRPDDSTGFTVRELLIEQMSNFLLQQDKDKKPTGLIFDRKIWINSIQLLCQDRQHPMKQDKSPKLGEPTTQTTTLSCPPNHLLIGITAWNSVHPLSLGIICNNQETVSP